MGSTAGGSAAGDAVDGTGRGGRPYLVGVTDGQEDHKPQQQQLLNASAPWRVGEAGQQVGQHAPV